MTAYVQVEYDHHKLLVNDGGERFLRDDVKSWCFDHIGPVELVWKDPPDNCLNFKLPWDMIDVARLTPGSIKILYFKFKSDADMMAFKMRWLTA